MGVKRFVVLDKHVGETPLSAISAWKSKNQTYARIPASYAGRLDPMASGKLLVLLGEECKRQSAYTSLDKEYEIEVLLDAGSDTGDVLGLTSLAHTETPVNKDALKRVLDGERGGHLRAYPIFSSKTVGGKPLFMHALEGTLSRIKMPEHKEHIYRISLSDITSVSASELRTRVEEMLDTAPHTDEPSKRLGEDFRIDAVRAHWKNLFATAGERNFAVFTLRVTCASGTYMRSLAGRIGASLGTRALALSIRRTKIGKYMPLFGDIGWWLRTY